MPRVHAEHIAVLGLASIATSVFLGFVIGIPSDSLTLFDSFISSTFALSPSSLLFPFVLFASSIGNLWPVITLTCVAALALLLQQNYREALLWPLTLGTAGALSEALKYFFLLERPLYNLTDSFSPSYPSGHATAIATLVTLFLFSFVHYVTNKGLRIASLLLCGTLVLAVSLSRIILGAHWFSDVLGGFFLGTGIALASFGLSQLLVKKRT